MSEGLTRFYRGYSRPWSEYSADSFITADGRVYEGNYERTSSSLGSIHDGYVYTREYITALTGPDAYVVDNMLHENTYFRGAAVLSIDHNGYIYKSFGANNLFDKERVGGIIGFSDTPNGRARALGMAYLTLLPEIKSWNEPKAETHEPEKETGTVRKAPERKPIDTRPAADSAYVGPVQGASGESGGGCMAFGFVPLVIAICFIIYLISAIGNKPIKSKIAKLEVELSNDMLDDYELKWHPGRGVFRVDIIDDVDDYKSFRQVKSFKSSLNGALKTDEFEAKTDTIAIITNYEKAYSVSLWLNEPGVFKSLHALNRIDEYHVPSNKGEIGSVYKVKKGLHYVVTITPRTDSDRNEGHGHILTKIKKEKYLDDLDVEWRNR